MGSASPFLQALLVDGVIGGAIAGGIVVLVFAAVLFGIMINTNRQLKVEYALGRA